MGDSGLSVHTTALALLQDENSAIHENVFAPAFVDVVALIFPAASFCCTLFHCSVGTVWVLLGNEVYLHAKRICIACCTALGPRSTLAQCSFLSIV